MQPSIVATLGVARCVGVLRRVGNVPKVPEPLQHPLVGDYLDGQSRRQQRGQQLDSPAVQNKTKAINDTNGGGKEEARQDEGPHTRGHRSLAQAQRQASGARLALGPKEFVVDSG